MSSGDLLFQDLLCLQEYNCGPTVVGRLVISRNAHICENIYFMMCHETGTICYGLMVTLEKLQGSYCCYSYKGVYFRRCCCFLLLFFHINLKELHSLVSALLYQRLFAGLFYPTEWFSAWVNKIWFRQILKPLWIFLMHSLKERL